MEQTEEEEMVRLQIVGETNADVSIDVESHIREGGGGERGGQFPRLCPPIRSLTLREMDSLTAISDTLLPSIDAPAGTRNDSVHVFFRTSASMLGTPQHVGAYMSGGRLEHALLWLLRVALWFLSTWYGTFFMCGTKSLSNRFPYFQKLSDVEPRRREEILRSWTLSPIFIYRLLFKSMKYLILLTYFSQVNAKNQNPTWEALGYCGPDPDFIDPPKLSGTVRHELKASSGEEEEEEEEKERFGPLHRALVHLNRPRKAVSAALAHVGLSLSLQYTSAFSSSYAAVHPHPVLPLRHRKKPHPTIRCDAVVVGSGSGGGVVAGVLACAGYKVVVLEKGRYHARRGLTLLEGRAMENLYEGGGLLTTDDLSVVVLAGSTVGGGSAVNWSASIRTPEHVADEWCDGHGLELFGSDAYREAMDAVCGRMGVQAEVFDESFNNAVLRRGCEELGYPVNTIPRNAAADHYCGWCCFGCKDGRKKATSETWLVDAVESGNGVILPGCKAVRVLSDDMGRKKRRVAGGVVVEFENEFSGKRETCVVESKVTVVACGALNTPALLRRSGLRNPNIGRHLHLHPTVMAWGYFPKGVTQWPEEGKRSYEGGIMTAMSTVVANFKTNGYGAVIQTPALHPGMFSVVTPWTSGDDFKDRMTRFSRTAHLFALARDRGSGAVGEDFPKSLRYALDGGDEENLKKGVEKMLRILAAAGAEEVGTHGYHGRKKKKSSSSNNNNNDHNNNNKQQQQQQHESCRLNVKKASSHEFERFVRRASGGRIGSLTRDQSTPICSAHQMGSCRMGVHPHTSAVDPRGETWEVEGLFVADASVLPTALGVNPMVTVQGIAYCTAQSVLQLLRRSKKINYELKNT